MIAAPCCSAAGPSRPRRPWDDRCRGRRGDGRKPLARYGAMGSALGERLAPELLHRQLGHDPRSAAWRVRRRWDRFRRGHLRGGDRVLVSAIARNGSRRRSSICRRRLRARPPTRASSLPEPASCGSVARSCALARYGVICRARPARPRTPTTARNLAECAEIAAAMLNVSASDRLMTIDYKTQNNRVTRSSADWP